VSDPFAAGWVLALAIGIGVATFTLARWALRARARQAPDDDDATEDVQVAEDEDAAEEKPSLLGALQTSVPLLLAMGAACGTFLLATMRSSSIGSRETKVAGTTTNDPSRSPAPAESLSSSDLLLEMKTGFMGRCSSDCTTAGASPESCQKGCLCTFDELRRRHPDDDAFAAWIRRTQRSEIFNEVTVARDLCIQKLGGP
jgi:hypothetical protein